MRGALNTQAVAACGCAACGNTRSVLSVTDTALGPQLLCGTCAEIVAED